MRYITFGMHFKLMCAFSVKKTLKLHNVNTLTLSLLEIQMRMS